MILVVHPDRGLRSLVSDALRADGHLPIGLASRADALARIETARFAGVITAVDFHDAPGAGLSILAAVRAARPDAARAAIAEPGCTLLDSAFVADLAHRVFVTPVDEHALRAWFGRATRLPRIGRRGYR